MNDLVHPLRDGLSSQAMEPQASPPKASIPDAEPRWTAQTIAVWQAWSWGKYYAFKSTFYGEWHLGDGKRVIFSAPTLQEVMRYAKAMETGTAKTAGLGAKHDSAVACDLPNDATPETPEGETP